MNRDVPPDPAPSDPAPSDPAPSDPASRGSAVTAPPGSDVILIAMVAANGVIGDGADQPWHLREDQRRFMRLTKGHPVVLGRRTWESIGGPLPGRPTVVLTRDPGWSVDGAAVAHHPQDALDLAAGLPGSEQIWVLGGGEVYAALLGAATHAEITEVDAVAQGQTRFPALSTREWRETARDDRWAFAFVSYARRAGAETGAGTAAGAGAAQRLAAS